MDQSYAAWDEVLQNSAICEKENHLHDILCGLKTATASWSAELLKCLILHAHIKLVRGRDIHPWCPFLWVFRRYGFVHLSRPKTVASLWQPIPILGTKRNARQRRKLSSWHRTLYRVFISERGFYGVRPGKMEIMSNSLPSYHARCHVHDAWNTIDSLSGPRYIPRNCNSGNWLKKKRLEWPVMNAGWLLGKWKEEGEIMQRG